MCGIFGYARGTQPEDTNPVDEVANGLRRLVYRGYDSWGYATSTGTIDKRVGEVPQTFAIDEKDAEATVIGHTRWATHGGVTKENAHPHESCDGRFAVVHNGVIENFEEIKQELLIEDHEFTSETDTEVIAHQIEDYIKDFEDRNVADALKEFDEYAEGNYAIVVLDREENMLYALKRGSPLVFAMPSVEDDPLRHPKGAYFASDLYAISDKADEAFFMKDGDIIMTSGSNLALMRDGEWLEGFPVDEWKTFEWTEEEPILEDRFNYWMEKEVHEQPEAMKRLAETFDNTQYDALTRMKTRIKEADKVIFTASGTSYHATLLGVYYLQQQGINAQTLIASEFENYQRIDEDTVVIAVSQSGETRDVLDAIQVAQNHDATIMSLVNTPHSTIQRESDLSIEIKAQQEICVAATKTFANQVYALMHLASLDNLQSIPDTLEQDLESIKMMAFKDAKEFYEAGHEDLYIIGNASTYPVAREIALKVKEISYIHAEGMMAGELKHGTLALIEEGTPVIALDDGTGKIKTNVKEVEARGGRTKTLRNDGDEKSFVFNATTYGFFLAMYWAHMKNLSVDKPRNLAKSVTVK